METESRTCGLYRSAAAFCCPLGLLRWYRRGLRADDNKLIHEVDVQPISLRLVTKASMSRNDEDNGLIVPAAAVGGSSR